MLTTARERDRVELSRWRAFRFGKRRTERPILPRLASNRDHSFHPIIHRLVKLNFVPRCSLIGFSACLNWTLHQVTTRCSHETRLGKTINILFGLYSVQVDLFAILLPTKHRELCPVLIKDTAHAYQSVIYSGMPSYDIYFISINIPFLFLSRYVVVLDILSTCNQLLKFGLSLLGFPTMTPKTGWRTLVNGGMTRILLMEKQRNPRATLTWSLQHSGWSAVTSSKSRAVTTLNIPLCCRPQVTVWVDRHSDLWLPPTGTLGMAPVGGLMTSTVWGTARSNMADSTKQLQVLPTRSAMGPFWAPIRSPSGVTVVNWMGLWWWSVVVEIGVVFTLLGLELPSDLDPSFFNFGSLEEDFGDSPFSDATDYSLNLWKR